MFREVHGLSVRAAARMIGTSATHLSRIERGRGRPSDRLYWRMVEFYATKPHRARADAA